MNFLLSTDDKYAMPTGVLICSICENNPGEHDFFILSGKELDHVSRSRIETTALKYSSRVYFLLVPEKFEEFLPIGREGQPLYISIATYYRLFLQSLLPESIDRILYLDGDIICRASLLDLWDTDLSDKPAAAVFEVENGDGRYERLCYPQKDGYYNAGVLLINVSYWRIHNAQSLFMDFVKNHSDRIVYHDQDVLNTVFHGKIKTLPLRYNVLNSYFVRDKLEYKYDQNEIDEARRNPILVHYSSHLKPWYKGCGHPYTKDFVWYKKLSSWRDVKFKLFPASDIRGKFSNVLVFIGLKKYFGNYINVG